MSKRGREQRKVLYRTIVVIITALVGGLAFAIALGIQQSIVSLIPVNYAYLTYIVLAGVLVVLVYLLYVFSRKEKELGE